MQSNSDKQLIERLRKLDQTLGSQKLPYVPRYLVQLARNQKRLKEIRSMKLPGKKQMSQMQMKQQGMLLESFKVAFYELDILHKKSVIQLKAIEPKMIRLKQLQNTPIQKDR